MSKQRKSAASVFLVTILTSLVFLGSTAVLLMNYLMTHHPDEVPVEEAEASPQGFTPKEDRSQTILLIADCGKEEYEKLFLIIRFLPSDQKLLFLPIPGSTTAQVGLRRSSLNEFYRTGGSILAREAAESAVNLPVERYIRLNREQLRDFINLLGGADYSVPFPLENVNDATGEITNLSEGAQHLDGILLRQMLTFPEFKDGEAFRMKLLASSAAAVINGNIQLLGQADLGGMFRQFVNNADTNITANDFSYREDAIRYALESETPPAEFLLPEGEYSQSGDFSFSRDFKTQLAEEFQLSPIVT